MNATAVWSAVSALVATASCAFFYVRRRAARRRRCEACARLREHALGVVAVAESLVGSVRDVAAELTASAPWQAIRTQQTWLADSIPELRHQLNHPGLRKATADLCEALRLLDAELRRNRTLAIPAATPGIDNQLIVSARFHNRADDLLLAARFMSIVAYTDACGQSARCSCTCDD